MVYIYLENKNKTHSIGIIRFAYQMIYLDNYAYCL